MKKLILLAAALLFSLPVFSDIISMESVFDSLTSNKVTCGNFTQEKSAAKLKKPLKSSGTYIFSQEGVVWQTLKPFPSTMAVTKSSIIQSRPNGTKTVTDGSSNQVFKSVAEAISSLFAGNRSQLEAFFNIKSFNATDADWTMVLEPKDSTIRSALNTIQLGGSISGQFCSMDKMVIVQSPSESVSYSFSQQVYSQELTDEQKALFK